METNKYYKWVKASEEDLPTKNDIIRVVDTKWVIAKQDILFIDKEGIHFHTGDIWPLKKYEWLKELSPAKIEEDFRQMDLLNKAASVLYRVVGSMVLEREERFDLNDQAKQWINEYESLSPALNVEDEKKQLRKQVEGLKETYYAKCREYSRKSNEYLKLKAMYDDLLAKNSIKSINK